MTHTMAIQVFSRLSKCGSQINKTEKKIEPRNTVLPGTIIEVGIRNIC